MEQEIKSGINHNKLIPFDLLKIIMEKMPQIKDKKELQDIIGKILRNN